MKKYSKNMLRMLQICHIVSVLLHYEVLIYELYILYLAELVYFFTYLKDIEKPQSAIKVVTKIPKLALHNER